MIKKDDSVYIIAEIGGNHEGDFQQAKSLLNKAIQSGADAIKFQIYSGDTIVNKKVDPDRVKHFDKFALQIEQYLELYEICKKNSVHFLASVWDEKQIDLFKDKMPFFKIGSGDLNAFPIIKKICNTQKPILISTGLSDFNEVKKSIEYIYKCDDIYKKKGMLGVLQCTSMYPIPNEDANLNVITTLKNNFPDTIVGYSDHTEGLDAIEIAVSLGAKIIEVHFTDDRKGKIFRDHKVSLTSLEIKNFIKRSSEITKLLGSHDKKPTNSEVISDHITTFRRGLYPRFDFEKNHIFSENDFICLRPCMGISASEYQSLIGKKNRRKLKQLEVLDKSDFYP